MEPHTHISAVHAVAFSLFFFAVISTIHLIAITHPDSRFTKAFVGMGW